MVEEWKHFLNEGKYKYYNYKTLADAMLDSNIYTTIFNNQNSMAYLINHEQLIKNIKQLDNYSSTLVSYLLDSSIYTDEEKYNNQLPFYLYNKGKYSTNLFIPATSATTVYLTSPTVVFKSVNNYLLFSSTGQYPSGCSTVTGYSKKNIDYANYSLSKINVTYINTTFPAKLAERYPYFIHQNKSLIDQPNISSINLSKNNSNSPYLYFYSCEGAYDGNGNYYKYNIEMHIDRWWIE